MTRTITREYLKWVDGELVEQNETIQQRIIEGVHCQQCGNLVGVDCGEWDGYTSCCNEIAVWDCDPRDCSHD